MTPQALPVTPLPSSPAARSNLTFFTSQRQVARSAALLEGTGKPLLAQRVWYTDELTPSRGSKDKRRGRRVEVILSNESAEGESRSDQSAPCPCSCHCSISLVSSYRSTVPFCTPTAPLHSSLALLSLRRPQNNNLDPSQEQQGWQRTSPTSARLRDPRVSLYTPSSASLRLSSRPEKRLLRCPFAALTDRVPTYRCRH